MLLELNPFGWEDLFKAVLKSWIQDAREDPNELAAVADWLEVEPAELQVRLPMLKPAVIHAEPKAPAARVCAVCGAVIRFTSDAPAAHKRRFCSTPCLRRATNERRRIKARP